jgi:hypothetical protein
MDWIDLAQDRDRWRALVNTVMNLGFHKILGRSWVAAQLAASQEGLSSLSECEGNYSSIVFNLGTRRKWVVCFTARPLQPQEKGLRYPLEGRLGGHQSLFGRRGDWKNLLTLTQSKCDRPVHRPSLYPSMFYKVGNIKNLPWSRNQKATRSQVTSCGICGGQSRSGSGCIWGLWFPLPILIPQTVPFPLIILSSTICSHDTDSVVKLATYKKKRTVST